MEELTPLEREALKRMPLADACYLLMAQVFSDSVLDQVWEKFRGRCYDRELSFAMIVELLESALFRHNGSGRASFDEALEAERLPVSYTAVYGKLGRLPLAVSKGLLQAGAAELTPVIPSAVSARPLAACFDKFLVLVIDGKVVKRVPRLLKLLRGAQAAVLGGKASVLLDVRTGLALAMAASDDGYADELALTRELLAQKDELQTDSRPTLLILDRLYCNREIPSLCLRNSGHFIIRFGGKMRFREDPDHAGHEFQAADGARITERWGWLNTCEGVPLRVRQITCQLPSGKIIRVVTDLRDKQRYPAKAILEAYRARWSIECVFQLITEVFGLDKLVVTTPRGTVFQLAFCLLLYDVLQVVKLIVAEQTDRPAKQISTRKLLADTRDQLKSLHLFLPIDVIVNRFHTAIPRPPADVRRQIVTALSGVWRPRWMKAKAWPRGAPTPKRRVRGNQLSASREIERHRKGSQRC
jgi:hypothetical protein